ncbi:RNA polymerase-associated protein CTR9 [Candida viswanathii]|uniref:RNA polymerase-associated protein CTR9 n=1 Tax=Candida viswanathii TaxID=5486 RepID=A0A367YIF1_9ASCO|nr:RNA polymerase-associated protein CTR9 [Candida viswanathii]
MEDPVDISYYIGAEDIESLKTLDVPFDNQVVSIDLQEELLDDPSDLIQLLTEQSSPKKYWIIIASAYAKIGKVEQLMKFIKAALGLAYFDNNDRITFESFVIWLHLQNVNLGIDKEHSLNLARQGISKLTFKIQNDRDTRPLNSISNLLCSAVLNLYDSNNDHANDIAEQILKINSTNAFALLVKAQSLLNKSKNYAVALKLFQQVLILNPMMKPDPRLGIGLCFWFLKDEKIAIQSWERSLELDPTNVKLRIFLNLAKFHHTFTNSLSDEEFLDNYKSCLQELSKIQKSSINDSTVMLTLAAHYFAKGDYDTVQKIIQKIVTSATGSDNIIKFSISSSISTYESNVLSQCATWLGRIEFNKSDFTQSSKYFQEAIKLNDNDIVAKLGLGQSQYNRGSLEEAIITFEKILNSNVNCLEANYSLGVLYSKQDSIKKKELAILVLERYIRLSTNRGLSSTKEPVATNAYLILSGLYENKGDMNQALNYLSKVVEARKHVDQDAPLEVYNNIGVFNFMKQNYTSASENFQLAVDKLQGAEFKSPDGDLLIDLPQDLKTTLTFNLARTKEISDQDEALTIYESLSQECPNYFSAKLRILFLNCISDKKTKQEIKDEIDELLQLNASDLEIRSFYGWFIKNFAKKVHLLPDADTTLQKETLTEYDSHDCYALISLANIYCIMARDTKGAEEKKKKYYLRSIELFTKVISLDPKNVYAAQGLAITFIENKQANKGLDILRKIRDSLNDISVYLNLGHVLCELKNFGKAIENYELALARYTDGNDAKILSFLGRAWYLRGISELNLLYLKQALEYAEKAVEASKATSKAALLYNVSFIQFQIADFITKQDVSQRNIEEIEEAITGLKAGIDTLNKLSTDEDDRHLPYPANYLKTRASLGSTTLLDSLSKALEETKESIAEIEDKIEKAKQLRQAEEEERMREEEEKMRIIREKEQEMAKQRLILQEQAQIWPKKADQTRLSASAARNNKKKKGGAKGKRGKGKKKNIIEDSDEEDDKNITDESDAETNGNGKRKAEEQTGGRKKKKPLSSEFINDSEEDLDELFEGDEE